MVNIQGKPLAMSAGEAKVDVDWVHFLQEHADYERKASEYALSIIGKFPDKKFAVSLLAQVAVGCLTTFKEICELMWQRQIALIPESPQNLYLKQLNWLNRSGREERFLDRLLLGNIAEGRCAARFNTISTTSQDASLSVFYSSCAQLKLQHADIYTSIAYQSFPAELIQTRMGVLTAEEDKIMTKLGQAAGIF
ncbi:hypothetical protein BH09BAC1_BH09BAC1_21880 [soil metagenome]